MRDGRVVMATLAVLFLLPVAAAWILIGHPDWLPAQHANKGELISPPVATPFAGGWTLVVPEGRSCDTRCRRLQWVASVVRYALTPGSREVTTLAECGQGARAACGAVAGKLGTAVLVIVDPEGNAVLRYGPEVAPRDVLQDLQRLLRTTGYWRNNGDG